METPNNLDLRTLNVGTKTAEKLEALKCEVINVETEFVEKAKLSKANFFVKHPKKEEPLKLNSATIMRQRKGKKEIVTFATWITVLPEDNGNFALDKNSTLSQVLKHYNANSLVEMVGKTIETEKGEDGYLTIKAY